MIAVIDKTPMSFDEFMDWYPDSENRYELRRGVAIAAEAVKLCRDVRKTVRLSLGLAP